MFTFVYILNRLNALLGTKPGFFLAFICTSRFLILAEAFRNDYVAACSTALRSATEKNELSGYVTVPFLSKMTQHSTTQRIGLNSSDLTRLVTMEDVRNNYSFLKSRSVIIAEIFLQTC